MIRVVLAPGYRPLQLARIDARGYGPRYGIAPNITEVGRAMNRRLSVKVLAK